MGIPFDFAQERPEHIDQILNGLDRYNPETTAVFQDYVMQQCESQTYDCYANLALLKLYVLPALISNLPASSAILIASYIFPVWPARPAFVAMMIKYHTFPIT